MVNLAPTELSEVLSPEWLSFALSDTYPGVKVSKVMVVETIVTMATKVRFEVEYEQAPEGAPRHFCLKGLFGDHVGRMRSSGVMEVEARFYREVAPLLSLRIPKCVYNRIADDGPYAVLIMEDVTIAKHATFLTPLTPYSPDQAASSLEQLAQLHALCWGGTNIEQFGWLTSRVEYFHENPPFPISELQDLMDGERGAPLPDAICDAKRIASALGQLAERVPVKQQNLVHGDCHAGNVYETKAGQSLVDWQLLQRSSWAIDLAYHISAVLSVEAREASQKILISHYLDCLRKYGVAAPSEEHAWNEYRAHMAYGYYVWAITRKVEPQITHEFVKRLGSAVDSLGTYEILGI